MTITSAQIEALDSVLQRAQEDWDDYYASGHGPRDFGNADAWRQHVRTVSSDLRCVRRLVSSARREARAQQSTQPNRGDNPNESH